LTEIEANAFRNTGLIEIQIPDSVTAIGSGAFVDCGSLSKVVLSKSLNKIGAYAFGYCDSLKQINIPKSVKETSEAYYSEYIYGYQPGVFIGSNNLKKITFEDGANEIPNGLCANNEGIEKIEIPDTVTKIENRAFENCINLKSVELSDSLLDIEFRAFKNTGLTEIDIPDTVSNIADGVFAECKKLSSVKLSKSLSSISAYAFARCEGLESIEIPKSLKTTNEAYYYEYIYGYQYGVFFGCTNLKNVTFEQGATLIPRGLFANNNGLEKIDIPDTIKKIDYKAFYNCSNLKEVTLHENLEEIIAESFRQTAIKEIKLPESVTFLENSIFSNTPLESIEISDNVTSMGTHNFQNCSSLKSVKLPESLKEIPSYTFENCTSLETIECPQSLVTIKDHAFKGCTALKEIKFNDNINKIDSYALENCDALETIKFPDSVTSYGEGLFYDCDKLTTVDLGLGMTSVPARMFEQCDILPALVLPYRTTTIGNNAFKECVKFKDITIPRMVNSISSSAFSYPAIMTIYGVAGTYAETFANNNNIKFVDKQVNATLVSIDKTDISIKKGKTEKLVVTILPSNFTDQVVWKSSNENVATIAEDGTITAKNTGTATIKITVGNVSVSCKVTVIQPVTSISISKSNITLQALEEYQLKATVNPSNAANKEVKWSSSDSEIASVDDDGMIIAHKKGTATIKVEALDGSDKYSTCKVVVSNNGVIAKSVDELESTHNYETNCNDFWLYTVDGASDLEVTFDKRTNIEDGFDYLYIYNGDNENVGKYTGTELAGETVLVTGDTVKIQLDSDDSGTEWGFKITSVKPIEKPHEHVFEAIKTVPATCGTDGNILKACQKCGYTENVVIPATGDHDLGDWKIIKPTCTKDGEKSRKCENCNYTETEVIASEHSFSNIINKATLTEDGSIVNKCTACGYVDSTVVIKYPNSFSLSKTNYFYDGNAKTPSVVVKDSDGKVLEIGTDYYVSYPSDCVDLGTYDVEITMNGNYSGTKTLTFSISLTTPTVKATNATNGMKVEWDDVEGADSYKVYRSTYSSGVWSNWKLIKDGYTSNSYTDTSVKSGATVKYTVRACSGSYISAYKDGSQTKFLTAPTAKAANASNGVKVTWGKISGANSYKVYRSTYSSKKWSSWKLIKDGSTSTSYTDKSVKSGATVKYTVRACSGSYMSVYKDGNQTKFLAQPKVSVSKISGGIKASWKKSSGATGYIVYRRTYSKGKWSGWKQIKVTKSLYYNDKTAKRGVYYQYTARAYSGNYKSTYQGSKSIKR